MGIKTTIKNNSHEITDVFYLIVLQGLTYVLPLMVLPYLMEVLGPKSYGYMGFSLAFTQYLLLLVDFGFNQSATKRVALAKDNQEELNKIFSSTLYAKLGLVLISLVVITCLSFIPQFQEYRSTVFVMFGTVIGQALLFVFLFQGLGNIRYVSIINAIAKFTVLPLTFIFVKSENDYLIAAGIHSSTSLFAAAISLIIVWRKGWVKLTKPNAKAIITELKEGLPLFLSSTATSIYTACFAIILGYFSTPSEVGIYTSSDRMIRALCFLILAPVVQAFYPSMSRIAATDKKRAKSLFLKLFFCCFAIMIAMTAAILIASPIAVKHLRPDFAELLPVLTLLSTLPIAIGMGGVAGQLGLLAIGGPKERDMFRNTYLLAAIVAFVGVFALTPKYEAIGAAIAMVITECVVAILMTYKAFRLIKDID